MAKSREKYAPVSKRAAVLYFVVSDLARVSSMYQFSLLEFNRIFVKALSITNVYRPSPDPGPKPNALPNDYQFVYNKISLEERLDMLTASFTHELFKRVSVSLFERDRPLFSYLLAFRVLDFDGFLDKHLYAFLLGGPPAHP